MQTGTITNFSGNPCSGLSFIYINNKPIPIESGFGLRIIENAFGSLNEAIGKEINYGMDCIGAMVWFMQTASKKEG